MTTKTLEQQANMKKQTFGVEIEMYGLNRNRVIKAVAEYYGTEHTLTSPAGSPYYTQTCKDTKGRTWQVMRDASIYAAADNQKAELVTPPLTWDDIADLQQILRNLRAAGAKSDPAHSCGVHVHIGVDGHNAHTLRTLANIMASHESLLIKALKIDSGRTGRWCRPVDPRFLQAVNEQKPKTMEQLARIWYQGDYQARHHYSPSRYRILNLHGAFEGYYYNHTIEFRLFQFDNPGRRYKGGLHAGKLKTYIQLCLALSQAAKDLRSASPKEPQHENPRFAMRTWLNRMGMIGDEYKTARDFLTKNLEGCAAWRFAGQAG